MCWVPWDGVGCESRWQVKWVISWETAAGELLQRQANDSHVTWRSISTVVSCATYSSTQHVYIVSTTQSKCTHIRDTYMYTVSRVTHSSTHTYIGIPAPLKAAGFWNDLLIYDNISSSAIFFPVVLIRIMTFFVSEEAVKQTLVLFLLLLMKGVWHYRSLP